MTTQEGVPPDSLVARMIGELNANPRGQDPAAAGAAD